jgi:hypothetical protein
MFMQISEMRNQWATTYSPFISRQEVAACLTPFCTIATAAWDLSVLVPSNLTTAKLTESGNQHLGNSSQSVISTRATGSVQQHSIFLHACLANGTLCSHNLFILALWTIASLSFKYYFNRCACSILFRICWWRSIDATENSCAGPRIFMDGLSPLKVLVPSIMSSLNHLLKYCKVYIVGSVLWITDLQMANAISMPLSSMYWCMGSIYTCLGF